MRALKKLVLTTTSIVLLTQLTACGGEAQVSSDTTQDHPKFSRAAVAISNAYAPTGNIQETKPTFRWKAVPGATTYRIGHEDVDTELRWHDFTISSVDAGCSSSASCSFKPDDIEFAVGDEKVWWVKPYTQGAWKNWSDSYVFIVTDGTTPQPSSQPLTPSGQINTVTPTFKWTPGNGATQYRIGMENYDSSDWATYDVSATDANCQSTECSYQPNISFNFGDQKTWWIKEKLNGVWMHWSEGESFNISSGSSNNRPLILKIDTAKEGKSSSNQFTVQGSDDGNYNVDCNSDGVLEATNVSGDYLCEYVSSGQYSVSISGDFPATSYGSRGPNHPSRHGYIYVTDAKKIMEISQWGDIQWKSLHRAFAFSGEIAMTASDAPDLSEVTDMSVMFQFSPVTGNFSQWNTSNVTNMNGLFGSYGDVENIDISDWDVSQVTKINIFSSHVKTVSNYDQMLIKWSEQDLQTQSSNGAQLIFDVGDTKYSASAAAARQKIIDNFNWVIKDGGQKYTPFSSVSNVGHIVEMGNRWFGIQGNKIVVDDGAGNISTILTGTSVNIDVEMNGYLLVSMRHVYSGRQQSIRRYYKIDSDSSIIELGYTQYGNRFSIDSVDETNNEIFIKYRINGTRTSYKLTDAIGVGLEDI